MKFKIITIIILISSLSNYCQEQLVLNVYQDFKLGFIGDNRGNNAFTENVLFDLNIELSEDNFGYPIAGFSYEYANLKGSLYQRYGVTIGYGFNNLFINNTTIALKYNYGAITRFNATVESFSLNGEMQYKLNEWLSISGMFQLTERNDKAIKYGKNANYSIDFLNGDISGFLGLKISLIKMKKYNFH